MNEREDQMLQEDERGRFGQSVGWPKPTDSEYVGLVCSMTRFTGYQIDAHSHCSLSISLGYD